MIFSLRAEGESPTFAASISGCKIDYSPYELVPRARLSAVASPGPRSGALLRVRYSDGRMGFSDCFPWPELGDLPLQEQLKGLARGNWSSLVEQSMRFAKIDAHARSKSLWLFQDLEIPRSHALISDVNALDSNLLQDLRNQGFKTCKLKMGRDLEQESQILRSLAGDLQTAGIQIRLDFNSSLLEGDLERFLDSLGCSLEFLDFIEDPVKYDPSVWERIQRKWGIRLALDRLTRDSWDEVSRESVSVLVLKPAIQDCSVLATNAKRLGIACVVTSYLDHPLGQLCAAWSAAQLKKDQGLHLEECGLLSQGAYLLNSFSSCLNQNNAVLTPPRGFGFGLDQQLLREETQWEALK